MTDALLKEALDAIEALSGNNSIGTHELIDLYEELISELEMRISALNDDLKRAEREAAE